MAEDTQRALPPEILDLLRDLAALIDDTAKGGRDWAKFWTMYNRVAATVLPADPPANPAPTVEPLPAPDPALPIH